MTTPFSCPDCGAPLELDEHAETETSFYCQARGTMPHLEIRRRPAVVAFCTGCEFAIEVHGAPTALSTSEVLRWESVEGQHDRIWSDGQ